MFTLIATIAKFLAGLIDLVQSFVKQNEDEKLRQAGRLEEVAVEQQQKEHDQAIADQVDALSVPSDKHVILDGLRSPAD